MKQLKKITLTLVALLSMTAGAWAQNSDEVTVTPVTGQTNQWEFTMPDADVELTPIYAPELTAAFKAGNANTIQGGKATLAVTEKDGTTAYTGATLDENGNYKPLYEGQTITMTAAAGYKFKSVTAAKKVDLLITDPAVGQIICSDGKNYAANATLPDGVTKVAMITYVGSETGHDTYKRGLAIALRDEGEMDWATAKSTCEAKSTFTNAAWMVPSLPQWFAMCKATGNDGNDYYGSMKYAMIAAAGEESSFKEDGYHYWSSSENNSSTAYCFGLKDDTTNYPIDSKNNIKGVRAVLAF